ncbi:MAG: hypothetical protein RKP46_03835 [Candidatus Accumulibacter sp.]|uniref:hypothetical protein n=1 Tax=Accumulibacter sp. TaxID=2053492 RepID=UPI002879E8CD|nr:hypothetical protein [Accumulibacter sp.]MDS4013471.1 hypothetical protein [Accumulibacter sp.]
MPPDSQLATPRIAIAAAFPHLLLAGDETGRFVIPGTFSIAQDSPSDLEILDSFVSTPSRYVFELMRRVAAHTADPFDRVLVFNPLLRPSRVLVRLVLAGAANASGEGIFCSSNDYPLAYVLDRRRSHSRYLLLLSCSSAKLDCELLTVAFAGRFQLHDLAFPASTVTGNGFLPGDYRQPMEWCAAHAIRVLGARARNGDAEDAAPAMAAFFPHHAGDVLFMALAARKVAEPLFEQLVVHRDYLPIALAVAPPLTLVPLDGPVPFRRDYRREDCHHFIDVAASLPADRLYVYCRTTRNYNFTNYHYVDHFRFCLGDSLTGLEQLSNGVPAVRPRAACRGDEPGQAGVLLHFDAGWPLKVYPRPYQEQLVDLLLEQGVRVIVLDAKAEFPRARAVRFESLRSFDSLLAEVEVVVGMDSFPAHYAAQIRGIPTIHLFSSTHPVHSGTASTLPHRMLQNGERCCPCLGWDRCVRYGGSDCRNFSSPHLVAQVVLDLLQQRNVVGGDPATGRFPPPPPEKCPAQFRKARKPVVVTEAYINLRNIGMSSWLIHVSHALGAAYCLAGEFVLAVRYQGLRYAFRLTVAFVRRHLGKELPR